MGAPQTNQHMTLSNISDIRQAMRNTAKSFMVAVLALATSAAYAQVPPDPYNYSRTSSFAYDASTGLLTNETVEQSNAALCVSTTYAYDGYGNKQSATTSNCAGASGRAVFATR